MRPAFAQAYKPRDAEATVLHRVVRDHLEEFLQEARGRFDDGYAGVPDFVEDEFRRFLACGHLSGGFARLKCKDCGHERLLPFSCKRRGVCPSCAGRRMAERAAYLVDEVFPFVPTRQWVLTLPFVLRYRMAWDHDLTRAVLRIFWRRIERHYRNKAKEKGLSAARTGGVTVIQRAGGALNLNVHFHTAVIDGVFAEDGKGGLAFHRVGAPTTEEVRELLKAVRRGVTRKLGREKLSQDGTEDVWDDPLSEEYPALAQASAASVQQLVAFGERKGRRVMRLVDLPEEDPEEAVKLKRKRHARLHGFDLHAGAAVQEHDRLRLERLLRYLLRPPVAQGRLKELPGGRIALVLKNKWQDGTTHIVFEPVELIEKLAAIIPKPQVNLLIYHGVLAPNAKWRKRVVGYGQPVEKDEPKEEASRAGGCSRYIEWAKLMRRTFDLDVLECPECGGRMKLLALIEQPDVIKKILDHLQLPSEPPTAKPARPPPEEVQLELFDDPESYAE